MPREKGTFKRTTGYNFVVSKYRSRVILETFENARLRAEMARIPHISPSAVTYNSFVLGDIL